MRALYNLSQLRLQDRDGFTFVEIIVTIAIISIMVAIFTFSYSVGRQYDTLKGENQRLASALRNARARDFNGIIAYNPAIDDERYPTGGYGLYLRNNVFVCSLAKNFFCSFDDECPVGKEPCSVNTGDPRTSYVLFADLNGDGLYNDYDEFLERFSVAKNFKADFGDDALEHAYLIFKNNQLIAKEARSNGNPITGANFTMAGVPSYIIDITYVPGCSKVRNKQARIEVFSDTSTIADQIIDCL